MTLKDDVLKRLSEGTYISGETMARDLAVSRAAIWKAIAALKEEGVLINAVRNKGYCLTDEVDRLDLGGVVDRIAPQYRFAQVQVKQDSASTNDDAKALAESGAAEFTTVIAANQSRGRGRRGRPFYSLGDAGVYLSMIIRPKADIKQAAHITALAAVAVCRAIEKACQGESLHTEIKWVNDIYIGERKVSGILTEGVIDLESGGLSYAVVGIGVNVYEPEGGYPSEIESRAGYVSAQKRRGLKNAIAGELVNQLCEIYSSINNEIYLDEYRSRSFLIGRTVKVRTGQYVNQSVEVEAIAEDLSLVVCLANGSKVHLVSDEVSIDL